MPALVTVVDLLSVNSTANGIWRELSAGETHVHRQISMECTLTFDSLCSGSKTPAKLADLNHAP